MEGLMATERAKDSEKAGPILAPGIGTRIKTVSEKIGTRAKAALTAGVSDDMLYRYIREESPPSFKAMAGLAAASGYSLDWMATGKGPMMSDQRDGDAHTYDLGVEFALIPRYSARSGSIPGTIIETESEIGRLAFRRDWLNKKGLKTGDLAVIRLCCDAMHPTIDDGDLALVDCRPIHERPSCDGIYALQLDGSIVARRVQIDVIGDGLIIMSDNPVYEPQRISGDEIDALQVIGRIIWVGGEI